MQGKKILIVILTVVSALLIFLYLMPMHRTFSADIIVSADELIIKRTITDTANWDKWYSDHNIKQPRPASFQELSGKKEKLFKYDLKNDVGYAIAGKIEITPKNRWDNQLMWTETIAIRKDIFKKMQLLFHPDDFKPGFLQNVIQFKNIIEHPDEVFGGLVFERKEMPATKLVTLSDTVRISDLREQVTVLHERLLKQLSPDKIKNPDIFLSQYELAEDSSVVLCVAVKVKDDLTNVAEPFELLEMDEHPAIMIQTDRGYPSINEDIGIMYEWLKRNDKRPATSYWVEHSSSSEIAKTSNPGSLTIIQEVYSLK